MAVLKTIEKTELSDDDLLLLYKRELRQETLAKLFLRYSDLVYGVCLKYLKDAEAAKDAVMNVYTELPVKVSRHSIDNFKSWLYVLTKNHCLMQLRKEKRMQFSEFNNDVMQSEPFQHPEDVFEREQNLEMLENCIDQLNREQKQTISLFYLQQKCYKDITEITGHDFNKVRSLVQNGRRNLKICMEKNGED